MEEAGTTGTVRNYMSTVCRNQMQICCWERTKACRVRAYRILKLTQGRRKKVTRRPDISQHQSLSQKILKSTWILSVLMFPVLRKTSLALIQLMALVHKTSSFCFFHQGFDSLCWKSQQLIPPHIHITSSFLTFHKCTRSCQMHLHHHSEHS